MEHRTAAGSGQRGVVLLGLLVVIAALGAGMAAAATFWHETRRRALETELIFVGQQYRNAIRQYYEAAPGGVYPPTLEALLLDERSPAIRRYLRRPFRDPLTNAAQWGLVPAPQGGIMGVYSQAPEKPIKQAGFPAILDWQESPGSYAEWKFVYLPAAPVAPAAGAPATSAAPATVVTPQ